MSVLRETRESVVWCEWNRNEISVLVRHGIQGSPPTVNGIALLPCAPYHVNQFRSRGSGGWGVMRGDHAAVVREALRRKDNKASPSFFGLLKRYGDMSVVDDTESVRFLALPSRQDTRPTRWTDALKIGPEGF